MERSERENGMRKKKYTFGYAIYSDQETTSKTVKLTKDMGQWFLTFQVSFQV